jgi:hypothetical protein
MTGTIQAVSSRGNPTSTNGFGNMLAALRRVAPGAQPDLGGGGQGRERALGAVSTVVYCL